MIGVSGIQSFATSLLRPSAHCELRFIYFFAPDILSVFIHSKDTVNDVRAAALSLHLSDSDIIYSNIAALE